MQILKKIKFIIVVFIILFVTLVQCKNDFKVNEDWSDISVVYGLISSKDTVHYIRLSKAFLGEQDAYQMAQVSDSLYYKNAIVYIEEDGTSNKIYFSKDSTIQKDSGIFAYDKNIYYKAISPLSINPDAKYKLNIFTNGKTITSETSLLQSFIIEPLPPNSVSLYQSDKGLTVKWTSQPNARIFETNVRFYYYEITSDTTTDTTKKYIDIKLATQTTLSILGNENMEALLTGGTFLTTVGNKVPNNTNVLKRVVAHASIEVTISVGSDDLYTYMQVNQPSTGIVSERPVFSNISNGLGLFTSKYETILPTKPPVGNKTIDSLAHGQFTKNLKFLDHIQTEPLWSASGFNFP